MLSSLTFRLLFLSILCRSSPVDKSISIPESYIPVHIENVPSYRDDGVHVPSVVADEGDIPVTTGIPQRDENTDEEQFPTPLPFLDEPEDRALPSPPSPGTLTPPNFDISKIPGITGVRNEQFAPVYVGRQACKCGVAGERRYLQDNNDTKIVNGEPASIEEYPWTVALLRRNWLGLVSDHPYCGGTLINNLYILTASHCVDGMSPRGIVVALHEEDVNSNTETPAGTQRVDVEKIIMHPNYSRKTIDHDIALLKLSKPVILNNILIPVCLPANNDHLFVGLTATAAGWGATKENSATSNILRKVDVPVISNEDCNTKTKYKGKITDNMLCAGYDEGGKDSCQGDSGGPLIIENGDRRTLIGIVSWGYGCARPNSPGVYNRVARYPEWIVANAKGAEWCLD